MQADDIRLLFDYSYAATARVLDSASRLGIHEFIASPPLQGAASLRHTLVHTLDTEQGWRGILRMGRYDEAAELDPEAFPDVVTLAETWHSDEAEMRAWLDTLDDSMLSAPVYKGRTLWVCLAHVLNHSTQHRSEAAMVLTHWGQSPGDLDLTFYLLDWNALEWNDG